jgi:hypothetical protein
MPALPQIAEHNYQLCAVATFLEIAPPEHIKRYRRDCIGKGSFIIWDPEGDADGFMVCGRSTAELNQAFLDHFAGYIDP